MNLIMSEYEAQTAPEVNTEDDVAIDEPVVAEAELTEQE